MFKKLPGFVFVLTVFFIILIGIGSIIYFHFNLNYQKPTNLLTSYNPVTVEKQNLFLKLNSPDDNSLVFDPDLLIQGKTSPKATVILSLDDSDQILNVNTNGDFSLTIKLKEKVNIITIASFDNLGNIQTESRTVYYSTEKL